MPFEGTTAIVTDGASGLGLAITEALVARGTKVAVFDIQAELLDTEVARLQKHGGAVRGYVVDVSDRAQVTTAVDQARADLGPVLILVNNAGVVQFDRFESITDELWERVMAVGTDALMFVKLLGRWVALAGRGRSLGRRSVSSSGRSRGGFCLR
ncbi:SDR family NAD(P)-dependent oxidoreductase [Frankia sp. Cpl3]|uniref:SDR family NAD(P)-dependent oxidoreductase n=1 Tax=Parafrankia colletiae TaxID=573497 RepID=UPI000A01D36B|nr:SDR family NAD(P)-dependent oxidoreductase [Parafrankia colletiae]MCK9904971.1 SDR family NAD(P)-dependent oxidoreductase [Frankia sp. Cpl3]